jgi:NADH-quinone oxidoreductase subunit J
MMGWVLFGVVSLVLIGSALMVVRARDLVHTVLALALTLLTTAGVYVQLHADFLAVTQVLLYTGGIVTLMLFAVMLTQRISSAKVELGASHNLARGAVVGAAIFGGTAFAVVTGTNAGPLPDTKADTQALGELVLTDLVLPFEVLGVVLLAAMIGAIVLARRDGPSKKIPTLKRRTN